VQGVYNLDGGYALKLTTAKWFTPSGRSIQRPRKFVNGQFVEDTPDSNETEASKKARPAFKSDAGRVVYGGGGITPDIIVQDDTLTTVEQQFLRSVAPKSQELRTVLDDYAMELSKTVKTDYQVQPAWMGELFTRLSAKGVATDRAAFDASHRYMARYLDQRITHFAFGDSLSKRRDLSNDAPLRRAISLLEKATSEQELFAMAGEPLTRPSMPTKKP
jgi:carboxyl-terminal processing protease